MHSCRFLCYMYLLSNLHSYVVVAAGVGLFSHLDLTASPRDFQSHLTMTYKTFYRSSPEFLREQWPIEIDKCEKKRSSVYGSQMSGAVLNA
jgi:hypothetical protein